MKALRGFALMVIGIAFTGESSSAQSTLEWMVLSNQSPTLSYGHARDTAVDAQGNVHVAYWSQPPSGNPDVDVEKYSPAGALIWSRRFDGGPNSDDDVRGIASAPNGDVAVCGTAQAGDYDLFVVRFDSAGNLLHGTVFPSAPGNGQYMADAIAIDAQGNSVIAGRGTIAGQTDMLVQSYSPTGALLWDRRIAGAAGGYDWAAAISIDPSGDIFVAGSVATALYSDAAIAKLDSTGTVQWLRTWGYGFHDSFTSLASDHQGGVVAGGQSSFQVLFSIQPGGLVARCDGTGTFLWADTHPQSPFYDSTQSVLMDASGVTWALHNAESLNSTRHVQLSRISPAGVRISSVPVWNDAFAAGLAAGDAGQVFAAGTVGPLGGGPADSAAVAQYDTEGAQNWQTSYAPVAGSGAVAVDLARAPNARLVLCGLAASGPSILTERGLVIQIDASAAPHGYCTPKLNSLGCAPNMEFTGSPSASAISGFAVRVENVLNQKPGLFLYSVVGPGSGPFGGGTLCVGAPVRRTSGVNSGGSPAGTPDCSGVFSIDMNAFAHGALGGIPAPELTIAGTQVWQQAWGRDNGFAPPNNVSLSSGLSYAILP